ncbi:hypothetical protein [Aliiruegeria haliotis]|nr:hypothetical protein [Aliiruegeria haliotis]
MSVIALSDDRVRMIGYSDQSYREGGAWQDDKSHWYFGDDKQIFDVFVYGENVGTINSAAGSLMQDTAYSDASGPVCLNDVFVDIGNTGDWDKSWYVGGGEDYIG